MVSSDASSVFPEGFLWGAATAGHQIEGNNTLSDHWALEHVPGSPFVEPSGDACDSYHRFAEDIALLAGAGLGTYRFSVEWSRIEPEPGVFSRAELDHYLSVVEACHQAGVTPMVTLQHFTTPGWFAREGAWNNPEAPKLFARYCGVVAAHFGDAVTWYCTLNEPNLGAMASLGGMLPMAAMEAFGAITRVDPTVTRAFAVRLGGAEDTVELGSPMRIFSTVAIENTKEAHRQGRAAVKDANPAAKVGWTLALVDFQAAPGGENLTRQLREAGGSQFLEVSRGDDFVGVQTYTREVMGPMGPVPVPDDTPRSQTGWEVYPQALGHSVRWAAEVAQVPVVVTENGMATADDADRIAYTRTALEGVRQALADGVDVRGYLHWSLLDNFEWHSGYAMTFGLIAVDRTTFQRTPKPSLEWLGTIARGNGATL
ncbi:glycoside hydrolase family 1 protein [Yinghuangia seranimata]|uniref:glycoside hydrolase family 1 protein n=1 Tax=Yinghuangia seranimata TaxID=408067 RepID=UPI00248ACB5F|nr:family 1 glycosylhydrolase [Yinghuangia seranimata]MDI2129390.1 family 1 glycosylhydrolase [Yinghuangia seranimata]